MSCKKLNEKKMSEGRSCESFKKISPGIDITDLCPRHSSLSIDSSKSSKHKVENVSQNHGKATPTIWSFYATIVAYADREDAS